jgi:hypothetical protein
MGMIKTLKRYCDLKKAVLKPYDFVCHHKENIYHIKTIRTSKDVIVTFYSRNHLSIKTGKVKDGRFLTKNERILSLEGFSDVHQGVIVFDKQPFKILKQLNESDIVEVSEAKVHHYQLISKEEDLIALLD